MATEFLVIRKHLPKHNYREGADELFFQDTGVALVKRYDGEIHKRDIAFFLKYTGSDEEYFWYVINRYRQISNVWNKENGEWIMPYLPE